MTKFNIGDKVRDPQHRACVVTTVASDHTDKQSIVVRYRSTMENIYGNDELTLRK